MNGITQLERRARKVTKALGSEVEIILNIAKPQYLVCHDTELGGVRFSAELGSPSTWQRSIDRFHEDIYHARAKEKYRMQGGKCSRCGRNLNGSGECNHIVHRSKGRDDRLNNLEIVCPAMSNGCDFHQREHGLTGQRRSA